MLLDLTAFGLIGHALFEDLPFTAHLDRVIGAVTREGLLIAGINEAEQLQGRRQALPFGTRDGIFAYHRRHLRFARRRARRPLYARTFARIAGQIFQCLRCWTPASHGETPIA